MGGDQGGETLATTCGLSPSSLARREDMVREGWHESLGRKDTRKLTMITLDEAANEFLARRRIAVAGVSRDTKQPANLIYRRLRDTGHEVFAVNPSAEEWRAIGAVTRASPLFRMASTGT
jgi:CoA binding domain